jgi:hypothetical protein
MSMNPLPPQAYTKETLARAYQWLATQPENIRELATSPDLLVSLYLKAKLNGDASLERPSIQNFRSELKQLSQMMDNLSLAPDQPSIQNAQNLLNPITQPPSPANVPATANSTTTANPVAASTPPSNSTASSGANPGSTAAPLASMMKASHSPLPHSRSLELDAKSWQSILEVQKELNLSSESEALRAVIALGIKRLRSI